MWRIEQGDRFGELQTVVHAAAKLSQAEAVWKPAAMWASRQPKAEQWKAAPLGLFDLDDVAPARPTDVGYEVRRSNGSAMLMRPDGSAWIPQAAGDQLGVSLSVSMALVDEAWDVHRWVVDNGLVPTMAEAASPQLYIVSTAGLPVTGEVSDLYPTYRAAALDQLGYPIDHLILEWSADPDADPGDPETWRQASPEWSDRRRALLEREWVKAQKSEKALATFRMQWLNQWPDTQTASRWIPARMTAAAEQHLGEAPAGAVCAIETAYSDPGRFAVALAWPDGSGVAARVWEAGSQAEALRVAGDRSVWVHQTLAESIGPRRYGVERVTISQHRAATNTLREVLRAGRLAVAGVPDEQWAAVRTSAADGGEIIDGRKSVDDVHMVKAVAWAVWGVQSGRNHSGFLFGAPPDEAHPGAMTA